MTNVDDNDFAWLGSYSYNATAGPWHYEESDSSIRTEDGHVVCRLIDIDDDVTLRFIVASHPLAVRELIDEVLELRERLGIKTG